MVACSTTTSIWRLLRVPFSFLWQVMRINCALFQTRHDDRTLQWLIVFLMKRAVVAGNDQPQQLRLVYHMVP